MNPKRMIANTLLFILVSLLCISQSLTASGTWQDGAGDLTVPNPESMNTLDGKCSVIHWEAAQSDFNQGASAIVTSISNLSLSIPANASVESLFTITYRHGSTSMGYVGYIIIAPDGFPTHERSFHEPMNTFDSYVKTGGDGTTWGLPMPSPSEFNSFAVTQYFQDENGILDLSIDWLGVEVVYLLPGGQRVRLVSIISG